MTETPESTVATPETVAVADPDGRQRPNRLYQALAWVGIVAGVLFIVGMVFFAGVFLGRTGLRLASRLSHRPDGSGWTGAQCPMMRGGGMGPGMMGPGGMDPDEMGPGGMMGPGRSPASTAPAPPPAQRPS